MSRDERLAESISLYNRAAYSVFIGELDAKTVHPGSCSKSYNRYSRLHCPAAEFKPRMPAIIA